MVFRGGWLKTTGSRAAGRRRSECSRPEALVRWAPPRRGDSRPSRAHRRPGARPSAADRRRPGQRFRRGSLRRSYRERAMWSPTPRGRSVPAARTRRRQDVLPRLRHWSRDPPSPARSRDAGASARARRAPPRRPAARPSRSARVCPRAGSPSPPRRRACRRPRSPATSGRLRRSRGPGPHSDPRARSRWASRARTARRTEPAAPEATPEAARHGASSPGHGDRPARSPWRRGGRAARTATPGWVRHHRGPSGPTTAEPRPVRGSSGR